MDGEGSQRSGKSLVQLTRRFMVLMDESGGRLDLKTLHTKLQVKQKRRTYDIINVLEGIGLIRKSDKYTIEWQYVFFFSEGVLSHLQTPQDAQQGQHVFCIE